MKKSQALFPLAKLISPAYNDISELQALLKSIDDEWELIVAIANRYLLIPALYVALQKKGLYDTLKDSVLKDYLFEIYKLNKRRNEGIIKQLKEICSLLHTIDITPVLLKGSAALSENHFDDIAQRSMMDIDILVPEFKVFDAIKAFKSGGYKEIDLTSKLGKNWHHYKRLYKNECETSVEIHRYILSQKARKYMQDFQIDLHTQKSSTLQNALVLEPTYEFFHTFLHSEVAHEHHDIIIALRHLHHGAILIEKYNQKIDFEKLQHMARKYKLEKVWQEYLYILEKLFFIKIPLKIPPMQKYEKKVCYNLDNEESLTFFLKIFVKKLLFAFSFKNLQSKYPSLIYRYQLLYYIPKRFLFFIYKITTDSKKRTSLIKNIKTTV